MATLEELALLFEPTSCVKKPNSISWSAMEMQRLFQEAFPFSYISTISGECLQWDDDFITKCLNAMATDSLETFSDVEKKTWLEFVNFEDNKSTIADTSLGVVGAIGCTVPDSIGRSYVVTENGITSILCLAPQETVAKENQSFSLDQVFMDLYNCEVYNDCGIKTGEVTDISPCPL